MLPQVSWPEAYLYCHLPDGQSAVPSPAYMLPACWLLLLHAFDSVSLLRCYVTALPAVRAACWRPPTARVMLLAASMPSTPPSAYIASFFLLLASCYHCAVGAPHIFAQVERFKVVFVGTWTICILLLPCADQRCMQYHAGVSSCDLAYAGLRPNQCAWLQGMLRGDVQVALLTCMIVAVS